MYPVPDFPSGNSLQSDSKYHNSNIDFDIIYQLYMGFLSLTSSFVCSQLYELESHVQVVYQDTEQFTTMFSHVTFLQPHPPRSHPPLHNPCKPLICFLPL
jgi:hypothetical protein